MEVVVLPSPARVGVVAETRMSFPGSVRLPGPGEGIDVHLGDRITERHHVLRLDPQLRGGFGNRPKPRLSDDLGIGQQVYFFS